MKEDNQINIPPEIDEETKKIEEILGITSEEDVEKSNSITRLKLKDVIIDDFSKFLPYLGSLRTLYLSDCTITNFSELLKLDRCIYFYLDNVTFRNSECNIIKDFPYEIRFSNMNFDAGCLNGFQASGPKKGHKLLEIENCHIDNIQELNNIAGLSRLTLDKITFTHHPKKIKQKSIRRIDISDSQFEDVSFIPFKKSVRDIDFTNCQIGSITGLSNFKKLREIAIDTNTTVEDTSEVENPFNKEISCRFFVNVEKPINLKNVLSLKKHIKHLHFTNFKGKTIDNIGKFENISRLSFYESEFYVDAFLPVAKQIKRVDVNESAIKNHNYFTHFLNLTSFELSSFEKENIKLQNFLKLLPLKDQLKELDFYESQEIPLTYSIEQFTALKTLKIGGEVSIQTAESILTLKKLKRLDISIEKTKQVFDIGRLKKVEFLIFHSNVHITGFEHLKRLKSLDLSSDNKFKTLPKMKSLKRLNFYSYDCKIDGLSRFPNLEFLKLKGVKKLKLKTLRKLKVLDLENSEIKDFSSFEILPLLEKLDLSSLQNNINLNGISKFPNLKWLSLLESEQVDDISGLESLKKLERLDLLSTKVTDLRVLNSLPNLKEVNLAVRDYYKLNLEAQLNRPEIAIYSGLPMINLRIWKEDKFGI